MTPDERSAIRTLVGQQLLELCKEKFGLRIGPRFALRVADLFIAEHEGLAAEAVTTESEAESERGYNDAVERKGCRPTSDAYVEGYRMGQEVLQLRAKNEADPILRLMHAQRVLSVPSGQTA